MESSRWEDIWGVVAAGWVHRSDQSWEMQQISYSAQLQASPEVIGTVPEGIRVNFHVTSGEVTGPKIRGILRPVGGDWLTICTDGIGLLDVRATIQTHDNALIDIGGHRSAQHR